MKSAPLFTRFADVVEHILYPCQEATFRNAVWQKTHRFFSRHDPTWFDSILPPVGIDELLRRATATKPENVYLTDHSDRNRTSINPPLIASPGQKPSDAASANVSVLIRSAQLFWPELHDLLRDVEQYFTFPTNANLYYSPAAAVAYQPHYDSHDVIVLQVEGSKLWRLGDRAKGAPLDELVVLPFERKISAALRRERADIDVRTPLGAPTLLRKGDALYIPRGVMHWAHSESEPSLHITIGIFPLTWSDLFHVAIRQRVEREELMRASLPIGFAGSNHNYVLSSAGAELLGVKREAFLAAYRELQEHYGAVAQCNGGYRIEPYVSNGINLDSVVRRRPGVLCTQSEPNENTVQLRYLDQALIKPKSMTRCFGFVLQAKVFRVTDCPFPGSDDSKLDFIRTLVSTGLLEEA